MYIYIYVYIYIYKHAHTHTHTQTCTCACAKFRMGLREKFRTSVKETECARAARHMVNNIVFSQNMVFPISMPLI